LKKKGKERKGPQPIGPTVCLNTKDSLRKIRKRELASSKWCAPRREGKKGKTAIPGFIAVER